MRFYPLLLAAALVAGCASEPDDATAQTADAPGEAAPVEATADAAPAVPGADGPAFAPPALSPASVSPETPVPVTDLRDAILAPLGTTATVGGYVHQPFGDPHTIGGSLTLAAEPGQTGRETKRLGCTFEAAPDRPALRDELVVVRGTVGQPMTAGAAYMRMEPCELVSVGPPEAAPEHTPAEVFWNAMLGWIGTEVAVTGRYNGTTTSELASGTQTSVRLEAGGTEGLTDEVAECVMADGAAVPDFGTVARDGVVLRGTVTNGWNVSRRTIRLEDCTFVGG